MEEHMEIDERFKQENGDHFESCLVCQKNVLEDGGDYFIERVFRNVHSMNITEVLFEYAMCFSCAEQMRNELSKESRKSIESYFEAHARKMHNTNRGTHECLLTSNSISAAQEYSLHAHCRGNQLIHSIFPYAICDQAMDELAELLSNETLDFLDDFKGKYFSGPPEVMDLINPKRLVTI